MPPALSSLEKGLGKLMSAWPNNRGLYAQLQNLAQFIAATRHEISSLSPAEVKQTLLPKAADELDAIVEATAAATNQIMDASDIIMSLTAQMPKVAADKAVAAVTTIYEACSFQDITGQRVTKVIKVLKLIEERIEAMVQALDEGGGSAVAPPLQDGADPAESGASQSDIDQLFDAGSAGDDRAARDAALLNGPAARGEEKSQDEIDAIFGGLTSNPSGPP